MGHWIGQPASNWSYAGSNPAVPALTQPQLLPQGVGHESEDHENTFAAALMIALASSDATISKARAMVSARNQMRNRS